MHSLPISCNYSEFPGLHRQCLASVSPKPDKINSSHEQKIKLKCRAKEDGICVPKQQVKNEAGDKQDCNEHQRFVKHTQQPPQKSGRRSLCHLVELLSVLLKPWCAPRPARAVINGKASDHIAAESLSSAESLSCLNFSCLTFRSTAVSPPLLLDFLPFVRRQLIYRLIFFANQLA